MKIKNKKTYKYYLGSVHMNDQNHLGKKYIYNFDL
jgi:hypothetical protein